MSGAPLIRLEGITQTFKGPDGQSFNALDNLSWTHDPQYRLISIVGPDGSGKTTLLRTLTGLLVAQEGYVEVLGARPDPTSQAFIRSIGYMPQGFGLYSDLSVWENLVTFATLKGVKACEQPTLFTRLLKLTGLSGFESRLAGKLSGGMKQKLGLCVALISTPKLLILDEPTVGVDPLSRRELWSVIRRMQNDTGMVCILSSAYLEEAAATDLVLLMNKGRLLKVATPKEMIGDRHSRTYAVRGLDEQQLTKIARRLMRSVHSAIGPSATLLDAIPRGNEIHLLTRQSPSSSQALEKDLALPVGSIHPRAPTLEDAYADITFPLNTQRTLLPAIFATRDTLTTPQINASQAVIVAQDISRVFGNFVAVANTSFEVQRGEIFGILGPNGAGKTTTFRMLCGLLPPSCGSIKINGIDLSKATSTVRAQIGYVAQKFSLYAQLSVEQNLRYFGQSYGIAGQALKARIQEMLEDFDLTKDQHRWAAHLPLGAKRELAMACALIHRPSILFLDEATSGADVAARRIFWQRIVSLAESGTTVIVTTHFMEEAEYCDRFLIQDAGKVLVLGTPMAIRENTMIGERTSKNIEEAFIEIVKRFREREGEG